MTASSTKKLRDCIGRYQSHIPGLAAILADLQSHTRDDRAPGLNSELDTLIDLYEKCYPLLEQAMWSGAADFDSLLHDYQSLFREQEVLIQQRPGDDRYHFILSIPVADRPRHLRACLESIFQLCEKFAYGGRASDHYDRITIIVAEDSREDKNIQRHKDLVEEYGKKGLRIFHFDQAEQFERLQALPQSEREQLGHLLTTQPEDKFYLKGQAANRNLSYLKCLQLSKDRHRTLYYMVDSDQSFCVNRQTEDGEEVVYALNYFHIIDRLFRTTDTLMLTGKVVGDPPVSPAVMAANFLDDVTAYFSQLAQMQQDEACRFHGLPEKQAGNAAYHDMASLFGFDNRTTAYPYRCQLEGEHDHQACLADFAMRLNAFFFGEHPTRKTFFSYNNGFAERMPARTIYPGNYVVNYEGLKYIIPFGHLRLRMSGPTAGRLVAAEIQGRFVSVNLPHLHRRTAGNGRDDDYRPGVEQEHRHIDISNEFERQFFGDLMLFTTEALVKQADVNRAFEEDAVIELIEQKEKELLQQYRHKHDAILEKNRQLNEFVFDADHWWMKTQASVDALEQVKAFIDNIDHNFGERSQAWNQIQSLEHRAVRKKQIIEALMNYRAERDAWDRLFR